jgi:predicted nucleic acid-binding protein
MSALAEAFVLDASVIAKWFKKGEDHESEALDLRDKILGSRVKALTSEWFVLEIVRALVKANYPGDKIEEAYSALREIVSLEFIEAVPIGMILDKAKEIEIALSLFASDAVYLATAVMKKANLVTEDRHLLGKEVVEYARKEGVKIESLKEDI